MAGRPGRDRLIVAAPAAPPRRPLAVLVPHLVLAALLAVGGVSTLGVEAGGAEVVDVLGLLLLGELVLLGVAGGIAAGFDRFGPLLLVDALVAATVAAGVIRSDPAIAGAATPLACGLVGAGLAGAGGAAVRVRGRPVERILAAVALVGIAIAFSGSWTGALMPLVALAIVAAPDAGRGRATEPRPAGAPGRSRVAPDAAAILARRGDGPDDAA